ncbi:hypothetical protein MKW98_002716 [Papaver atlanticum]|uniref:Uncharacterized protein n=1 Tax=Papaver atlanticum TaxID=357466 RepID=A0AAD4SAL9_9MAGN|nr:hypothetical protein MKW98_002716 [Papaver atlanticum]
MATATHSADFKASYHPPETSKDNFRHTFAIRVTISDRNPRAMYEYFEKMGFKGAQVYMPATKRDHVAIVRFFTQNDAEKAIESCKDRYKASLDMFDPELLLKIVSEGIHPCQTRVKDKEVRTYPQTDEHESEGKVGSYVPPNRRTVAKPMEED